MLVSSHLCSLRVFYAQSAIAKSCGQCSCFLTLVSFDLLNFGPGHGWFLACLSSDVRKPVMYIFFVLRVSATSILSLPLLSLFICT